MCHFNSTLKQDAHQLVSKLMARRFVSKHTLSDALTFKVFRVFSNVRLSMCEMEQKIKGKEKIIHFHF
ncbi:hypothetical protein B9Z36_05600 [Limnohabitans sp. Rim8]|jgi:hypothetical protein|nr:hypothetical protein B9Z36_05600 [Limnohabitans sp. Rim8]